MRYSWVLSALRQPLPFVEVPVCLQVPLYICKTPGSRWLNRRPHFRNKPWVTGNHSGTQLVRPSDPFLRLSSERCRTERRAGWRTLHSRSNSSGEPVYLAQAVLKPHPTRGTREGQEGLPAGRDIDRCARRRWANRTQGCVQGSAGGAQSLFRGYWRFRASSKSLCPRFRSSCRLYASSALQTHVMCGIFAANCPEMKVMAAATSVRHLTRSGYYAASAGGGL
jgi:hypothetical protein